MVESFGQLGPYCHNCIKGNLLLNEDSSQAVRVLTECVSFLSFFPKESDAGVLIASFQINRDLLKLLIVVMILD